MSTLNGKTILITGGTGSFGHRFVKSAIQRHGARRVIVFSRDELKQHEMRVKNPDPRISYFIGDVRDRDRLYRAFRADVDLVIHTAALKQVPACEYNPFEAVKTNIIGAQNIIDAAIDCGIPKVLALSTDKAVNPANIYGATKLCAEKLFVHGNSYAGGKITRFACVRYGNVLGSRGSVLPVFLRQRKTGTITVTDPRMTRFWIRLEDAVEFVVGCVDIMKGGEIFVPMIPSLSVTEMIRILAPECKVKVAGIRPGEKLNEVLISPEEARHTIELSDRYVILPESASWGSTRLAGKPVPERFSYTSDNNQRILTRDELLAIVNDDSEAWAPSVYSDNGEQLLLDPIQPTPH